MRVFVLFQMPTERGNWRGWPIPVERVFFFLDSTHREVFSKSCYIKPKSPCIYHFPIDLEPIGHCPFGSKSIGKW